MADHIDPHKLIAALSKRPALYDKEHKLFHSSNHKYKQRLWWEIGQEVYENWGTIQPQKRRELGIHLQRRWKNLRTCFTREIGLQKKEAIDRREGREVRSRKGYEYFNEMLFLMGNDQKNEVQAMILYNEQNTPRDEPYDGNIKEELFTHSEGGIFEDDHSVTMTSDPVGVQREPVFRTDSVEVRNKDVNNTENNDVDSDRHFLLSLVNTFRKLDDKQKFKAKIEILRVLQGVCFDNE